MKTDKIVCPECGVSIKKSAVRNLFRGPVCPSCGIEITELSIIPKSKTVSLLLAVFFGFWSWLYTYKKDLIKFWICLGLMIGSAVVLGRVYWVAVITYVIGWTMALIDAIRRPKSFFQDYSNGNSGI